MRGKEGNSTTPTKFLPLHFVKLAALASLVKDNFRQFFDLEFQGLILLLIEQKTTIGKVNSKEPGSKLSL